MKNVDEYCAGLELGHTLSMFCREDDSFHWYIMLLFSSVDQ